MNILSLFAGIGGLDLGLHLAGLGDTIAHSEIEPYPNKIFCDRFPNSIPLGDITEIGWLNQNGNCYAKFENSRLSCKSFPQGVVNLGKAEDLLICGGFPCQDISTASQFNDNNGIITGAQSSLWRYFANAISILRPRIVVVENVSALRTRGIDKILLDLSRCGYDAEWNCVPASFVGAPHRRNRMFIIGYPTSLVNANGAPIERGSLPGGMGQEESDLGNRDSGKLGVWSKPLRSLAWCSGEPTGGGRVAPPGIHRMANGVPNRSHRLKALGNAVVPQVAEYVGGVVQEILKGDRHD